MTRPTIQVTAEKIRDLVGPSPLMVEIGCNDGTDTNKFLKVLPGARIYCFEPDPRAIARFEKTVNDDRASLIKAAVSDTNGSATFYGSSGQPPEAQRTPDASHYCFLEEWDLSGSLYKPTGHLAKSPWVQFPEDRQYTVMTMTLDAWLDLHREISQIDFIWADVQGAEGPLIRGGTFALSVTRYFFTEFYDTPLYEGQVSLSTIQAMLPDFDLLGTHADDALFKNRTQP